MAKPTSSATPASPMPSGPRDDVELSKLQGDERAKARRARQTLYNLLYSLAACIGLVIVMVLAVPRPSGNLIQPVKYLEVAASATQSSNQPIVAPQLLTKNWYSNSARWTAQPADGVANWYVGFVGPKNQYLGLTQAFNSNPTWLTLKLKGDMPTGSRTIDGRKWVVWKSTVTHSPAATMDYALVTDLAGSTPDQADQVIVYGTATKAEFNRFATLVNRAIDKAYQQIAK
jgi:hypothetical protein